METSKFDYILGLWRLRDSWENIHSVVCGRVSKHWIMFHAVVLKSTSETTVYIDILDEANSEESAERAIVAFIEGALLNPSPEVENDFKLSTGKEPPTLVKQHFFEVRSGDQQKMIHALELAYSIPI